MPSSHLTDNPLAQDPVTDLEDRALVLRAKSGDLDLPDQHSVPVDVRLLVEEARLSCTTGMLLCLDREQRLVYILGEIFEVTDVVGAELLEISRETFRQRVARARR